MTKNITGEQDYIYGTGPVIGKPMAGKTTGKIIACEPQWDFVFNGKDNTVVLKLSYDGKIEVFGDHDEAVHAFLSKLGEVYGLLPARLKEAEERVKTLQMINEGLCALCDKDKEEIERLMKITRRVDDLKSQLKVGREDGSRCNRQCEGVMLLATPENCSCHISSPCGACEDNRPFCSLCGEEVG